MRVTAIYVTDYKNNHLEWKCIVAHKNLEIKSLQGTITQWYVSKLGVRIIHFCDTRFCTIQLESPYHSTSLPKTYIKYTAWPAKILPNQSSVVWIVYCFCSFISHYSQNRHVIRSQSLTRLKWLSSSSSNTDIKFT